MGEADIEQQQEETEQNIPERRPKQMTAFSEGVFRNEFPPLNNIYIEFECFQDFNLGALLNMISTETEFRYIQSRLDSYQNRYDNRIAEHFPALGFTDQQVRQFRADPENIPYIHAGSPMTEYFYEWSSEAVNRHQPRRDGYQYDEPLQFYLNFGDVVPDRTVRRKWTTWAGDLLGECTVHFLGDHEASQASEFWKNMDVVIVRDIENFLNHSSVKKPVFKDMDMVDADVRAPYIIDPEMVDPQQTHKRDRAVEYTEKVLQVFCNFRFISRQLAGGGVVNNG